MKTNAEYEAETKTQTDKLRAEFERDPRAYANKYGAINSFESSMLVNWLLDRVERQRCPPFDGSAPCPFCPEEVRNLHAVAHNLVVGSRDTTIDDLARAVKACRHLSEAHFADTMHSHGHVSPEKPR